MKKVIVTAIMITGTCRKRAQRALNALYEQTIIKQMEIIVFDLGSKEYPPFTYPTNIRISIISMPKDTSWALARTNAVKKAIGEILAFIEDRSFAKPDWAEQVAKAFEEPWAAVGYSVVNANLAENENLCSQMGERGWQAWRKKWSEEIHMDLYFKVLDDLR